MDKELRPLYLKRRMQLIKAAEDEYEASQLGQVRKNEETPPESQFFYKGYFGKFAQGVVWALITTKAGE